MYQDGFTEKVHETRVQDRKQRKTDGEDLTGMKPDTERAQDHKLWKKFIWRNPTQEFDT